jgi:tetratricopeptide (TPR) repeat protein
MAFYGFLPPEEAFPRARAAAERALELEPAIADAHVTLALVQLFYDRDWLASEREFKTAIKLNPQLAVAHALYSLHLASVLRHDEAIAEARLGQKLDPLSLLPNLCVSWALHFAGRAEEAVKETLRLRELVPGFEEAGNVLVNCYENLGRYEDAIAIATQQPVYGVTFDADALRDAYRAGGASAYWTMKRQQFERAPSLRNEDFVYAVIHTRHGEIDEAFQSLERLIQKAGGMAVFIQTDPCLRTLRHDPRFEALIRRLGVPTASAPHTESK